MELFNQEKILVSTEEFFALYRGIADATNEPGFGLKLGTEERVERYDPVKIAALSARSFRDAVARVSRYKQLTGPEEIRVVERGNESVVQFLWLLAHKKEPPLSVDVCFAWMASRGIGRPLIPKRVVATCPIELRNVRGTFSLRREIQVQSERLDIQPGGHGTAFCYLQRGFAGDRCAAT
jgi:hypothetical protein